MSVTRAAALRRLVSKWLEATRLDPAKVAQLPLCEILTEDNVEAVRALDLYAEYDERPTRRRAWAVADQLRQQRARNQQLVRALGCRTRGQGCCNDSLSEQLRAWRESQRFVCCLCGAECMATATSQYRGGR